MSAGADATRSSFSTSQPPNVTPARLTSTSTPGVSAVYSSSVGTRATAALSTQDEIRSLRAQNEVRRLHITLKPVREPCITRASARVRQALQKQLTLKDQGLERLRQKVQERALMISHEKAADIQQMRRETSHVIEDLETENVKLRSDLAHRTSQLHSAVTRISALKSRIDDLILKNDELSLAKERAQRARLSARKRKQATSHKHGGTAAQTEALATLLGTQDSVLNLIENLSFLPPKEAIGIQPASDLRPQRSTSAPRLRPGDDDETQEPAASTTATPLMATPRTTPSTHATHVAAQRISLSTPMESGQMPPPARPQTAAGASPASVPLPSPEVAYNAPITSQATTLNVGGLNVAALDTSVAASGVPSLAGSASSAMVRRGSIMREGASPPRLNPPSSQSPRFQYAHKRLAAFEAKFGQSAKTSEW